MKSNARGRESRHFQPAAAAYTKGRAHGGAREIGFSRIMERGEGSYFDHVDFVTVPPGADIGFHVHAESEEEIYIVMEGSGKMRLGGREIAIREGDVIANAPGGGHGLVNDSGSDLRLVVVQCSGTAGPARPAGPQGAQG